MTTPTKEQINEILDQMRKRGLYWDSIDYEDKYDVLRFIITEWEKIRNSPKQGKIYGSTPAAEIKSWYYGNVKIVSLQSQFQEDNK